LGYKELMNETERLKIGFGRNRRFPFHLSAPGVVATGYLDPATGEKYAAVQTVFGLKMVPMENIKDGAREEG